MSRRKHPKHEIATQQANNFTRCAKDKNQTMKLKHRKSHPLKALKISKSTTLTKIKTGKYTKENLFNMFYNMKQYTPAKEKNTTKRPTPLTTCDK